MLVFLLMLYSLSYILLNLFCLHVLLLLPPYLSLYVQMCLEGRLGVHLKASDATLHGQIGVFQAPG